MRTKHRIIFNQAQKMSSVKDGSVNLIITSPPYPMIEMWDDIMALQNPQIAAALSSNNPTIAFELMHKELDAVWKECYRVLNDGGFLCINIGDATRTLNGNFQLYNNHSRIVNACLSLGFSNLPNVIWRKQTNAPNKFMGSGMLPCGAYITLEHEYILVFRKGSKRLYKTETEKAERRASSFFWEERNNWFSDVWELKGIKQKIDKTTTRERSAAYPLEIPFRLINMYSQQGDVVLDPFMGIGTTCQAAILTGRNSIGYEIDTNLRSVIKNNINGLDIYQFNNSITSRYNNHLDFIKNRIASGGTIKYINQYLNCPVMTGQETDLQFHYITQIEEIKDNDLLFQAEYEETSDMQKPPLPKGFLI